MKQTLCNFDIERKSEKRNDIQGNCKCAPVEVEVTFRFFSFATFTAFNDTKKANE